MVIIFSAVNIVSASEVDMRYLRIVDSLTQRRAT